MGLASRHRAAPTLLATGAGVLQTASFAPLDAWVLQIAAVALLATLVHGQTPRRAAWLGWVFGVSWLASGLWWLFISLHRYGGLPGWLAVTAVLALAALLALYYAAAMGLWARWRGTGNHRSPRPATDALAWAGAWLLAELARAVFFTGFPWIASGYAHTGGLLAPWAPWVGVYVIGFLAAWLGAALAFAFQVRQAVAVIRTAGLPVALAVLGWGLPQQFTASAGPLTVSLLQSNVRQDLKFDPASIDRALEWHAVALRQARGQLVVSPEASLPLLPKQIDADQWRRYQEPLAALPQAPPSGGERGALLGLFTGGPDEGYMNSVIGLTPDSDVSQGRYYRYGKRHLLPFGEFIPPGFGWFVQMMNIPIGDQARGSQNTPFVLGAQRIRPLICYEHLFGEDFAESVIGADAATVLVNVSNLAWFGRVMIQDQDLQFSRMRALEFQRPLVRATNTGSTAAVDHHGTVIARMAPETQGVLEVTMDGRMGATPYARWLAAAGLWPLWALALFALWGPALFTLLARRDRRPDRAA